MSQPNPLPPLSEPEREALEILSRYGIDFAPAYIGRARPYLNTGHYDNKTPEALAPIRHKSAQQIVTCILELIKFDEWQRLQRAEVSSNRASLAQSQKWDAEYEFWTKIMSDQVARRRFNEGFEPIDCILYELKNEHRQARKFLGITKICGREFECSALPGRDADGRPILKLSIRVALR